MNESLITPLLLGFVGAMIGCVLVFFLCGINEKNNHNLNRAQLPPDLWKSETTTTTKKVPNEPAKTHPK